MGLGTTRKSSRGIIDVPLLILLLCSTVFFQVAVQLARVATSYQAVALGLGPSSIGFFSAAFAVLPILLALPIGRLVDRGATVICTLSGTFLLLISLGGYLLVPPSFESLILVTAMLGLGQLMTLSALQYVVVLTSTSNRRDSVLGNFAVSLSLGQLLGPLFISIVAAGEPAPDPMPLYFVSLLAGIVLLFAAIPMVQRIHRRKSKAQRTVPSGILSVLHTQGLLWLVLCGGIVVTASDLMLVYLPVLGVERQIGADSIGIILSVRAGMAMLARFFLSAAVQVFGRRATIVAGLVLAAISLAGMCFDLGVWAMLVLVAGSGFGLGLAGAAALSLTLNLAPKDARATALSLRLTGHRVAQLIIPAAVGSLTVFTGVGIVFGVIGATLAGVSIMVIKKV